MGVIAFLVVTAIGSVALATGVGAPIAACLGFSAIGPIAGTAAAGAQAFVGSVGAGSVFSALQAIAMGAPTP